MMYESNQNFDARAQYPEMCTENAHIINQYYYSNIDKLRGKTTFASENAVFNLICKNINDTDVKAFREWDKNSVINYINGSGYSYSTLSRAIKILKDLLEISGCKSDISDLSPTHLMSYNGSFLTFDVMNKQLKASFHKYFSNKVQWYSMNELSNAIVVCYLQWLGLKRNEIPSLEKHNYSEEFNTISYTVDDTRIIRAISDHDISRYFEIYNKSSSYTVLLNNGRERNLQYRDGYAFLKSTNKNTEANLHTTNNAIKRLSDRLGISGDSVWEAGRLNSMYSLEKTEGVQITMTNIDEIAERLCLRAPKGQTKMTSEVGRLIIEYKAYRERRDIYINNILKSKL